MRRVLIGFLALVACLPGGGAGGAAGPLRAAAPDRPSLRVGLMAAGSASDATRPRWRGGPVTAATGERVTIEISDAYAPEAVSAQRWADFFAALVHGDELGSVTVRIGTPAEVGHVCGSGALGCYHAGVIVLPGEPSEGVPPEEIARHEYGHHIAANRSNAPWRALEWGTKRWASLVGVCARTAAGQLFPGGGGFRYGLAPGEGFAEAYRVLDERRAGASTFAWSIVDRLFFPDSAHLDAIERDVRQPWTGPIVRTTRARFVRGGAVRRRLGLDTPLDGTLAASLTAPAGRLDDLELVDRDGTVLARGLWAGARTRRLSYEVCGQRALALRITLRGRPGPFALSVAYPGRG